MFKSDKITIILSMVTAIFAVGCFIHSDIVLSQENPYSSTPDSGDYGLDSLQSVVWQQFPLRSAWQTKNNLKGGEGMQRIFDFDWNEKDPNVIYFIVDTKRVWKSIDAGNNWFPLGQNLRVPGGVSIVSDPNNSDVVFFAGLWHNALDGDYDGIYRSLDGGVSFEGPIGDLIHYKRVHAGKLFYIYPDSFDGFQSNIIFAGTPHGILRSTDGGKSFQNYVLMDYFVYDLEWSKSDTSFFLVATDKGLFKVQIHRGISTEVGSGLPVPTHPWEVSISQQDASIVYAATGKGVYKSIDGGVSFTDYSNGIYDKTDYQRISVSRFNDNKILLVPHNWGHNLPYWSHDGGETWHEVVDLNKQELVSGGAHWSAKPVLFSPVDEDVALRYSSTIVKTEDAGETWHYKGEKYIGAEVDNIVFISKDSMLFCLADYGLLITHDGGNTFSQIDSPSVNGMGDVTIADVDGNFIIAAIGLWHEMNLFVSNDMGTNWKKVNGVSENYEFIKINKENKSIIYADNYISKDRGETWTQVSEGYEIRAVDPKNDNIIYGIKQVYSNRPMQWQVAVSNNFGHSWELVGRTLDGSMYVGDIAIDPHSKELHMFVASDVFGIHEYKNGTWNLLIGDEIGLGSREDLQRFLYVRFDPLKPGIVWVAKNAYRMHGDGVFLSKDNGRSWSNVINNLGPYQNFSNLDISPYDGTVYLTGSGVWTFSFGLSDRIAPLAPRYLIIQ